MFDGWCKAKEDVFVSTGREINEVTANCNKEFPVHHGAFIRSLEQELGSMYVHREAYYGGTFTGNSAHRCLKVMEQIFI